MRAIDWEISKDENNWDNRMEEEYEGLLNRAGLGEGRTSQFTIVSGTGKFDVIDWQARELVFQARSDTEMTVTVNQFYFPNWKAHVDGETSELAIQPSKPDGLISLTIPKGDHTVRLLLEKSDEELTGQRISLVSLIVMLFGLGIIRFQAVRS